MRAKDIMSTPVITATPGSTLKQIVGLLIQHDISAVPIVDDAGDLVGIVSEADIVPLQSVEDPRRHALPSVRRKEEVPRIAAEVMAQDIVTVTEDEDVTEVARLMLDRGIKRIPVMSGTKVTGIISRRDILKVLVRSDASIQAELHGRFDDEAALLGQFNAEVMDGVVTMKGPEEEQARRLAEVIARSIPGVVAVRFAHED